MREANNIELRQYVRRRNTCTARGSDIFKHLALPSRVFVELYCMLSTVKTRLNAHNRIASDAKHQHQDKICWVLIVGETPSCCMGPLLLDGLHLINLPGNWHKQPCSSDVHMKFTVKFQTVQFTFSRSCAGQAHPTCALTMHAAS